MNRRSALRTLALSACAVTWLTPHALAQQTQPDPVKDPVCGMKVDPAKAKGKSEYKGKTYYFCSTDCKTKFDKDPAKYAEKAPDPKK